MAVSRTAIVLLAAAIQLFTSFVVFGILAQGALETTSRIESMDKFNVHNYPWLFFLGVGFIFLVLSGVIILIVGIICHRRDKRNGIPLVKRKKEPVSIRRQTVFAIIPVLDLYAAYKIEKLIMYSSISTAAGLGISYGFEVVLPFPYHEIATTAASVSLSVYLIRHLSKKWNKRIIV